LYWFYILIVPILKNAPRKIRNTGQLVRHTPGGKSEVENIEVIVRNKTFIFIYSLSSPIFRHKSLFPLFLSPLRHFPPMAGGGCLF